MIGTYLGIQRGRYTIVGKVEKVCLRSVSRY